MEEEKQQGKGAKTFVWLAVVAAAAGISFAAGMFIFKKIGYDEGVRFAIESGSKQAYSLGFEMGYQLRDSIAKREKSLWASDQFNLDIIEQEAGSPLAHILISGEVLQKEVGRGIVAKYVSGRVTSTAQFARYKEITVNVKFLGKRNELLKEQTVSLEDILYPGRSVVFEISHKDVPEFTEAVEMKLEGATGVD